MITSLLTLLGLQFVFGSVTIQSYVCQPPDRPTISVPANFSTVTAGSVEVDGTATASSTVTIVVDSHDSVSVTADQNNNYAGQVNLTAGSHQLQAKVVNPCGANAGDVITVSANAPPTPTPSQSGSSTTTTTRNTATKANSTPQASNTTSPAPALTLQILSPKDRDSTTNLSIFLIGSSNRPATFTVSIGGKQVAATFVPSTSFGLSVPVVIGENTLHITATGEDAQQASVDFHITRIASSTATVTNKKPKPWYLTLPGEISIALFVISIARILVLWRFRI